MTDRKASSTDCDGGRLLSNAAASRSLPDPSPVGATSGRKLFTTEAFRYAMAHRNTSARSAERLAPRSRLIPETLDERPDRAVAWVTGLYALVLGRRPDVAGFRTYVMALRSGAAPESVVDQLMASPEAITAGARRPDLLEAFITGAYLTGLGRIPDPAGLADYKAALAAGANETTVLESLLASDEAASQLRFPPAKVDDVELLGEKIQTVALHVQRTDENTAWVKDALRRGVPPRQVVRSLGRRMYGVSRTGVLVAATARWRAAMARRSASAAVLQEELLRDRAWQWRVHRSTWERLDRIEQWMRAADIATRRADAPEAPA